MSDKNSISLFVVVILIILASVSYHINLCLTNGNSDCIFSNNSNDERNN